MTVMNSCSLSFASLRRWLGVGILLALLAGCKPAPAPEPGPSPLPARTATPDVFTFFLPMIDGGDMTPTPMPEPPPTPEPSVTEPLPTELPSPLPPPSPTPTPAWPEPLVGQTASKLSLHVIRNEDPYIMEFVRRIHPRVIKGLDDNAWLSEVKEVSPGTITVGRFSSPEADVQEHWPDSTDPVAAAQAYVDKFLERYRLNPGVDYWEGWNEFNSDIPARWEWFAKFEAERACYMQARGLRAAVGGFPAGTPEFGVMALFLPALEAAHRCGGIFTLHEGVYPIIGCGLVAHQPNIIPGAPALSVPAGAIMIRYRFWYEAYLKPRGLGDLPLVISELAVGGIDSHSPCNGPGGADWKSYRKWWVQQGVGKTGPEAYVNVLAWYDAEMRQDPYVIGTTIFTAGAVSDYLGWTEFDVHEALIPLAWYAVSQP